MTRTYDLVALIPMKGHSERVPGKNFRQFAGKPLFRWIVDTLLSLDEVDLVVVNTDARKEFEAAGLGGMNRVLLRDRRPDLCGDFVSTNLLVADDLSTIRSSMYLMTHATNPLLTAQTIRMAIARFRDATARAERDSLFTVNRFNARFYDVAGRPLNHDPTNLIRTQDLEPWFEENSNLYLFTQQSFSETKARIGRTPLLFETPRAESIDIDDATSWNIAEALALRNCTS